MRTKRGGRNAPSLSQAVPIAVYGTLRIGQGNHQWSRPAVIKEVQDVTIKGRIYFAFGGRSGYPVAKLDEDGIIHADLLWWDYRHSDYIAMHRMERGAGYELRPAEVTLPGGESVNAFAWHYLHPPRGKLIRSGDWLAEARR